MHMKPELGDDDDEEKVMKDIETKDPFEPRLKALSNDKPVSGYPKAWNVRLFNDQSDYVVNGFVPSKTCNGIIDLQSLVWPGAHVIYSQGQQSAIYVGNGFKACTQLFYPKEPQSVLQEPLDIAEQPEPQIPKEEDKQDE